MYLLQETNLFGQDKFSFQLFDVVTYYICNTRTQKQTLIQISNSRDSLIVYSIVYVPNCCIILFCVCVSAAEY